MVPRLMLIVLLTLAFDGCRQREAGSLEPDSRRSPEPDRYSATVVRITEDGARREVNVTRVTRFGEQRRDEWTEEGKNRALIWRPDAGKAFLLDLDSQAYAEVESGNRSAGESDRQTTDTKSEAFEAIERVLDDPPSPTNAESRKLADQVIDGHRCTVFEQRASYSDGHTEVTRTFRASDFEGLVLRVETGTSANASRVIVERHDVSLEVQAGAFIVPSTFKKVEKIPR